MPTFKGRKLKGELHVTAARVKTKKSKRRPGKSAHVAVDVKPAVVYTRSYDEILVIDAGHSVRTSSPPRFSRLPATAATRRGEGRGADSTIKSTNGTEPPDGLGMSGSNVQCLCSPVWLHYVNKNVSKSVTGNRKSKPVTGNFTRNRLTDNRITALFPMTGVTSLFQLF